SGWQVTRRKANRDRRRNWATGKASIPKASGKECSMHEPSEDFPTEVLGHVRGCLPLVRFGFDQPADAPLDLDSVAYRVQGLKDKDPAVRHRSALFLGAMGRKAESAVPAVFEALEGLSTEQVRQVEERCLKEVITPNSLPAVLKAAKARSPRARKAAVALLYQFRDQSQAVVPVLLAAFKDESELIRRLAAEECCHRL